ncbi:MAG: universal stress protein [Thiogranum sp.]
MRNLLVAVDLSEMSGAVVERAACIAQSFVGKLWLIHVAPASKSSVPFNLDRDILRTQVAKQLRLQRRQLRDLANQLRRQRIHVVTRFLSGTVSTTILAEADRITAELIIMGSHGHGNVYHALFGGVGQKVMRKATCPVMLVPPQLTKPHWHWMRRELEENQGIAQRRG